MIMTRLLALLTTCAFAVSTMAFAQEYAQQSFSPEPLIDKVTRTGKLEFKRTTALSFKTSGYLRSLKIDEGQVFKSKTQLAALDISELIEQKNAAYSRLVEAKKTLKRAKRLLNDGVGSEEAVDNAETLVETTRSDFKIANYNLEKSTITAPFNGLVLTRHTELDELQSPGTPVLTVASLENNWVIRVQLTEKEVIQLKRRQQVDVQLRKIGSVSGIVSKIPAIADPVTNLYTIEISLPDVAIIEGMIAGQMAEVTFYFEQDSLVYRVPLGAISGVTLDGEAEFVTYNNNQYQTFSVPILSLDNQYAYLDAYEGNDNISLIVQGWQHVQTHR